MQKPAQPPVPGKIMCGVHRFVVLAQELGTLSLGQVSENQLGVIRITIVDRPGGHAVKPTTAAHPVRRTGRPPGATHGWCPHAHGVFVEPPLIVALVVLSLPLGGFRKGTKVNWARPVAPPAAAQHPSPPPR